VAASLKKEPGLQVELVNGDRGEFTVSVDGKVVARKGETLPDVQEVLALVRKAGPGDDG
jgi:hypothetical protein